MSNSLAVATVTAAMRNLLFAGVNQDLAGTTVTARPPDRARANVTGNQLNLFLYQTAIDAAWRNQEIPGRVKAGEIGAPPLPLVLHYLLTAYSDDDELLSHRILGRAMGILHDHPRLGREELRVAFQGTDLHEQVERVHVTPLPMTVEELSKLWTTFQTPLRISAAYQACVVLIESTLPVRSAMPVLTRGADDHGPTAVLAARPVIGRLVFPSGQAGATSTGTFTILGANLGGGTARVVLRHPRLPERVELVPTVASATALEVDLSTSPVPLPAGTYSLLLNVGSGATTLSSDPFALGLAPVVTNGLPAAVARVNGIATIGLTIDPPPLAGQDVALLIGGQVVAGTSSGPGSVTFDVAGLTVRDYLVRVRVDGADSFLFDLSGPQPAYDQRQKVTVTA